MQDTDDFTGERAEDRIKAAARHIGFDAVRITSPASPGHADQMSAWLEAGMQGEMEYLAKRAELRAGPLDSPLLLAETRSLIVVALSYAFPVARPDEEEGPHGTVARYARGEDYHPLMWEKLSALGSRIEAEWPEAKTRGFADSGPLRERELAARAGIGWQGKHTNLISLDLGNWFLLGALLTTLSLEPDPPFVGNHCGTCTRCLAACPTGAIIAPLTLDARRCISYLTIELRGTIPVELRPLIGDRIFGCDDCLAACPWNDKAAEGREARLSARDTEAAYPALIPLLEMLADEEAFRKRFRGTPLLRPKRAGLRRNVCVALGNVGGTEALGPLAMARDTDPSEIVREHADWAIKRIEARIADQNP